MKQNKFIYPIIGFTKTSIHIARRADEILVCTMTALKNNFYKNMKIIDSEGVLYKVDNAVKIKGHGFLWGYNIFLNQKIEVELILNEKSSNIDIEELKKMLITSLKGELWSSMDNYDEILKEIKNSNDIRYILSYLAKVYYNSY